MRSIILVVLLVGSVLPSASALAWFGKKVPNSKYKVSVALYLDRAVENGFISANHSPAVHPPQHEDLVNALVVEQETRGLFSWFNSTRPLMGAQSSEGNVYFYGDMVTEAAAGQMVRLFSSLTARWRIWFTEKRDSRERFGTMTTLTYERQFECASKLSSHVVPPDVKRYTYLVTAEKNGPYDVTIRKIRNNVNEVTFGAHTLVSSDEGLQAYLATLGPVIYRLDIEKI